MTLPLDLSGLDTLMMAATTHTLDLDSVKRGPRWFDLAVMAQYSLRYDDPYPFVALLATSGSWTGRFDELRELRLSKEVSSAAQLRTRWCAVGVEAEFWRRTTLGAVEPWSNIVGTRVTATGSTVPDTRWRV
jgi:hypothetical protein